MSNIRAMLMAQVTGQESLDAAEKAEVKEIVEKTAEEVAELVADNAAEEVKAEVKELADEVEDIGDQVDEIEEDVEELEECVDGMEALLQAGAYNSAAFGLLYKRANKLHGKLGGAEVGSVMGTESLGDATSAALASRAGMEGFMETLKSYKDSAVKFIQTMYNAAINYVKSLLDKSLAIENQVKTTMERLNKAEELKTDVKPGKWAALAKMHTVDKLIQLLDAVDGLVSAGAKLAANDVSGYASAYGKLKSAAAGLSTGEGTGDVTTHTLKMGPVTIAVSVYDGEIKDQADVAKAAKATRMSFSADKSGEVKFDALTKSTAGTMLQQAAAHGGKLAKLKDSKAGNEKGRDELIADLNKLATKEEEWVKPAVSAIKASTVMTNNIFTVASRLLGNIADAKIAAVKAYL